MGLHGYDDRSELSKDAVRRIVVKSIKETTTVGEYEIELDSNLLNPLNNPNATTDIEVNVTLIEEIIN